MTEVAIRTENLTRDFDTVRAVDGASRRMEKRASTGCIHLDLERGELRLHRGQLHHRRT
jgi:hypothetical protein